MVWYSPNRGAESFSEDPIAPQACSELAECKRLLRQPDPFEGVPATFELVSDPTPSELA